LDLGEREILKSKQAITMHDVDRLGMVQVWNNVDSWLRAKGFRNIYVSFDVDAFDPVLAPGTGTAVRGGLTYREGHLLAEMICESLHSAPYRLVGMDIMEVSPIHDMNNQTAIVATEWVASLLGKTIMGANG
jgi:arginase